MKNENAWRIGKAIELLQGINNAREKEIEVSHAEMLERAHAAVYAFVTHHSEGAIFASEVARNYGAKQKAKEALRLLDEAGAILREPPQ